MEPIGGDGLRHRPGHLRHWWHLLLITLLAAVGTPLVANEVSAGLIIPTPVLTLTPSDGHLSPGENLLVSWAPLTAIVQLSSTTSVQLTHYKVCYGNPVASTDSYQSLLLDPSTTRMSIPAPTDVGSQYDLFVTGIYSPPNVAIALPTCDVMSASTDAAHATFMTVGATSASTSGTSRCGFPTLGTMLSNANGRISATRGSFPQFSASLASWISKFGSAPSCAQLAGLDRVLLVSSLAVTEDTWAKLLAELDSDAILGATSQAVDQLSRSVTAKVNSAISGTIKAQLNSLVERIVQGSAKTALVQLVGQSATASQAWLVNYLLSAVTHKNSSSIQTVLLEINRKLIDSQLVASVSAGRSFSGTSPLTTNSRSYIIKDLSDQLSVEFGKQAAIMRALGLAEAASLGGPYLNSPIARTAATGVKIAALVYFPALTATGEKVANVGFLIAYIAQAGNIQFVQMDSSLPTSLNSAIRETALRI